MERSRPPLEDSISLKKYHMPSRSATPRPSRAATPGPSRVGTPGPSRAATPRPGTSMRSATPTMVPMVPVVPLAALWRSKAAKARGVIAIFLALSAIFLNIVWFIKPGNQLGSTVVSTGLGFWIGVLLLATGVLAVFTAPRPSEGQICALLILCIITLMADLAVFALACAQIALAANRTLRAAVPVYAGGHMAFGIIFLALSVVIFAVVLSLGSLSRQVLQHATWQSPVVYMSPYGADMSSVKSMPYIIADTSRPVSRCPSMRMPKR